MERMNKKVKNKFNMNYTDKLFDTSLHDKTKENYYEENKKNKYDQTYKNYDQNYDHNYNYEYDQTYNQENYYQGLNTNKTKNKNEYNNYYDDKYYYNDGINKENVNKYDNYNNENYYQNEYEDITLKNQSQPKKTKNKKSHKKQINHLKDISNIINRKENIRFYLEKYKVEAPELTMNLINGLIEASIECMICNEDVDSKKEIWECDKCYTIYHNTCIYDWIFKLNMTTADKTITEYKWTCPHCSQNYQANADSLPTYNCYCKRFYEPQTKKDKNYNPNLIPHGCGLDCNTEVCPHVTCHLPCHPGPHVQCSIIEKVKCYCEKLEKELPCQNQNKKFACTQICEKFLICKKHKCKQKCHDNECENFLKNKKCEECIVESKNKFYIFLKGLQEKINVECKENLTTLADGLSEYIFHGTLFCNQHFEEPNTDSNLEFLLKLLKISGNRLAENIKKFIPICKQTVDNSCDCRNKIFNTECYKLNYNEDIMKFLNLSQKIEKKTEKCPRICRSFKNCRIHRCTRVCCELADKLIRNFSIDDPEGHHLCLLTCDKDLNCGFHKCEGFCHKGNCKPCPNIIREGTLYCECKRTKMDAPFQCGIEVNCKLPCNRVSKCEHVCKLLCHKDECPPCEEITFKVCRCKKSVINGVKCGDEILPICKEICNEMLPCGVHFCQIKCHEHNDAFDLNYFCMMPCGRDFFKCKHKCLKRCHGDDECIEVDCESQIKIFCKCKTNYRNIKCGELKKLVEADPDYIFPCNEECQKKDRLKKIEQAFEDLLKFSEEKNKMFHHKKIDESEKLVDAKFDYNLLEFAKRNVKCIVEIESLVEKSLKNQTHKYELPRLEKKMFIPICEFLKTYYNIKIEKVKRPGESWTTLVLNDCSEAVVPKYKLSLFALLFKHNKFAKNTKLNIYHPFEMSILLQNYRFNVIHDDIENFLCNFCQASKMDFYVDEIEKGKSYIHFFNLENGKKVFYQLKHKANQFQEAFEIYYNLKDNLKISDLYSYLKNQDYFNSLYYKDEEEMLMTKKEENLNEENMSRDNNEPDDEGFVKISKGKKPK